MISWSHLIPAICARPRMYVINGTFLEVCAWLDGRYIGLRESSPDEVEEWEAFADWLQRRFQYPRNIAWWSLLAKEFPEDSMAFVQLSSLYKQFLDERECVSFVPGE